MADEEQEEQLKRQRPSSPDFAMLSGQVAGLDTVLENGADLETMVATEIDIDTLFYVSLQRAMRMPGARDRQELHKTWSQGSSLWIEAFLNGIYWERTRAGNEDITALRKRVVEMQIVEEVAMVAANQFQKRLDIIMPLVANHIDKPGVKHAVIRLCHSPSIEEWMIGIQDNAPDVWAKDVILETAKEVIADERQV